MMATVAPDTQKQRYSQELAEYTFRQYDAARQSVDAKRDPSRSDGAPSPTTDSHNGQPFPATRAVDQHSSALGVQSTDFARR
jgi:hypothetical protein